MVITLWSVGTRSRETSGWQSPAGGGGVDWAMWWGSPEKKLGMGGLEAWPGRRQTGGGECFRGGRGGTPPAAGGGGLLFGRWWLAAQGGAG